MGFRFRKSIELLPGVRINLSTGGASVSVGGKGATINLGKRGVRTTYDLPGTGGSYTTEKSWGSVGDSVSGADGKSKSPSRSRTQPRASAPRGTGGGGRPPAQRREPQKRSSLPVEFESGNAPVRVVGAAKLNPNFFQRLSIPDEDEKLIDGLRALFAEDYQAALALLAAAGSADGDALAGVAALRFGIYTDAATCLQRAADTRAELGKKLKRYGLTVWISFELARGVFAHVRPDAFGVLLALAEAQQRLGRTTAALLTLRELLLAAPRDVLVRLSLAELLTDSGLPADKIESEIAALGEGIENDDSLHAALLLYQARALRRLGLLEAAYAALTRVLSKRKDRPLGLLLDARYERASVLSAMGDKRRAQEDLQRIYADDPEYLDVAEQLGRV